MPKSSATRSRTANRPSIHGFWLEALKIDADYRRTLVTRADFPTYLAERRADPDWRGCNVTMPLKLDAVALADDATDRAVAAGAANLLLPREGKLIAANTDVGGVIAIARARAKAGRGDGQRHRARQWRRGARGAGGAALAQDRQGDHRGARHGRGDASWRSSSDLRWRRGRSTTPIDSDGLINATPLGMPGYDCLNCDARRDAAEGLGVRPGHAAPTRR